MTAAAIRLPRQPHSIPGTARTGAASIAIADVVADTNVAARPAAAGVVNRSAAAAPIDGARIDVDAPISRQKAASANTLPMAPSAAEIPSNASPPAATNSRAIRSIKGASENPTISAARPPSPRSPPISATFPPAAPAIGTKYIPNTVNGIKLTADASKNGHNRRAIHKSPGTSATRPPPAAECEEPAFSATAGAGAGFRVLLLMCPSWDSGRGCSGGS
jgi:hypothetical protein